ncbi:hypothetical protein AB0M48_41425 [Lentzea sp. NPDC051208]
MNEPLVRPHAHVHDPSADITGWKPRLNHDRPVPEFRWLSALQTAKH